MTNSQLLRDTADVLEKVAEHMDQQASVVDSERAAAHAAQVSELSTKVGSKVDVDDATLGRIAEDPALVEIVTKLASDSDAPPDDMGEGHDLDEGNTATRTKTGSAQGEMAPEDARLLAWVNGD
jgi:hypothetical protein